MNEEIKNDLNIEDIPDEEEPKEFDYSQQPVGLPPAKFCPNCKSLVRKEATICNNCGYSFVNYDE